MAQQRSDYTPQQMAELDAGIAAGLPQAGADDAMVNEQLDMLVAGRGPEDWRQQLQQDLGTGFAKDAAISDATRQRINRLAAAYQAQGLADTQQTLGTGAPAAAEMETIIDQMVNGPFQASQPTQPVRPR